MRSVTVRSVGTRAWVRRSPGCRPSLPPPVHTPVHAAERSFTKPRSKVSGISSSNTMTPIDQGLARDRSPSTKRIPIDDLLSWVRIDRERCAGKEADRRRNSWRIVIAEAICDPPRCSKERRDGIRTPGANVAVLPTVQRDNFCSHGAFIQRIHQMLISRPRPVIRPGSDRRRSPPNRCI